MAGSAMRVGGGGVGGGGGELPGGGEPGLPGVVPGPITGPPESPGSEPPDVGSVTVEVVSGGTVGAGGVRGSSDVGGASGGESAAIWGESIPPGVPVVSPGVPLVLPGVPVVTPGVDGTRSLGRPSGFSGSGSVSVTGGVPGSAMIRRPMGFRIPRAVGPETAATVRGSRVETACGGPAPARRPIPPHHHHIKASKAATTTKVVSTTTAVRRSGTSNLKYIGSCHPSRSVAACAVDGSRRTMNRRPPQQSGRHIRETRIEPHLTVILAAATPTRCLARDGSR